MHDATADLELPGRGTVPRVCSRAPSKRHYLALLGAAALSGAALHMVRSTTAADLPDPLAQHLTRPTDLPQSAIDTSLQPMGL